MQVDQPVRPVLTPTPNVWCVLVMLNDNYAAGAAVVAKTLRNLKTKYSIWCIVSDGVSAQCTAFLESQFDRVVYSPLIQHPVNPLRSRKQNEIYGGWIHASFTKWSILNPALFDNEVSKVILVDADMLFLENCDDLFDLPAPALTFSSPWGQPYIHNGIPNFYGEMTHGTAVPHCKIRRAFRGGFLGIANMVLVSPSEHAYKTMLSILRKCPTYGNSQCVSGQDEQLIAETFLRLGAQMYHIHQQYNWTVGKTAWLKPGMTPKTQQYYNGKPWRTPAADSPWPDVADWWAVADQIINSECTDLNDIKKWFCLEHK